MNAIRLLTAVAEQTEEVAEAAGGIDVKGPLIIGEFELFGQTFYFTETTTVQWVVMLILVVVFFLLGRNLKVVPEGRRQAISETIVGTFVGLVKDSMGESYSKYTPYIGALFCFSMTSSLMGLLGFKPPTSDFSMIIGWGIITFILVQRNRFKTGGVKNGLLSLTEPIFIMTPNNIIGEVSSPVSQSFRHFGNILAGVIIGTLIYWACGNLLAPLVIPAVFSLYFDIFGAVVQAFVFSMLTMVYITMADCSPEAE